eukprot:TRINITY_DN73413_c0_g1_i1.p1 TRINITY_DN73413_c0_g1~~TRINITY_DN73413_c0_g1_i1.p1  ORF type:complete len:264 (+),score=103.47 TRINITY_DN73413_c0_g1_i1:144-935(+)
MLDDDTQVVQQKRRRLDWVMPGDELLQLQPGAAVTIGRGARQDLSRITAVRAGQYEQHDAKHFVIADEKSYIPRNEDIIVGTVVRSGAFLAGYQLDAGCGSLIKLDSLAFDGASKRARPELKVGATVYCRVVQSRCEIELEASCCAVTGPRKDWMTGESLFGELKGGYVHSVRPLFARYLLSGSLLDEIGARVAFECCVGVNGRVWLRAATVRNTARIARCLTELQRATYPEAGVAYQTPDEVLDDFFPRPTAPKQQPDEYEL